MPKSECDNCGGTYCWSWEEAFNKFGFNDGDGQIETWQVEAVLTEAGFGVSVEQWGLHNTVITSIKQNEKELIPYDNPDYTFGYDDPREFLPAELVELLDREFNQKGEGDKNMSEKATKIANLNDTFRDTIFTNEKTFKTQGIDALPMEDQQKILELVRDFNDFSIGNDPYGEHDFGSLDHKGNKVYWKIDYYNEDMSEGSENPADPEKTTRVMTIMLAHEY